MKSGYSKLSFSLAIITGFFLPLTAYLEPAPYAFSAICFLLGGLFGFFWPKESWKWGFWISLPSLALVALSLIFTGQYDIFMEKDLQVLLIVLFASASGSFLFSIFTKNRITN